MTKQQAIETLKSLLLNIAGEKDCEAIELAIAALQSDPDAPDWSQAPEWATHYYKDSSGHGWWYECEPKKTTTHEPFFVPARYRQEIPSQKPIGKLFKRPDQ
jgi:hypothetical protein